MLCKKNVAYVSSLSKKSTFPTVFAVNVQQKVWDNGENTKGMFFARNRQKGEVYDNCGDRKFTGRFEYAGCISREL